MQAWIKIMLNCMFTILFTSMVLGVCFYLFTVMPALQAITSMVGSVLGQGGQGSLFDALKTGANDDAILEMFLLSIWLCIYFLKQVPGYAAAITGITVNSAYEMGHSIEHAGFAPKGKGDKPKPKKEEK